DYYRIQAFFASFMPAEVPVGQREEIERYQQQFHEWEAKTAGIRQRMGELEEPFRRQHMAKRKARFPQEYQDMFDLPADKRTPLQEQIAFMVGKQVNVGTDEVVKTMKAEVKQQWQDLSKQMAEYAAIKPAMPLTAMALRDVGPVAPPTHLLKRGNWR